MRITSFTIENFKNIRHASYENLPNFIVICGGNGCGKSSILEALMTAKEALGSYGYFERNPHCVSADASFCEISISFKLSENEIAYLKEAQPSNQITTDYSATIRILKDGNTSITKQTQGNVNRLFSRFSSTRSFFDFFSAHRNNVKSTLNTWNSDFLNEDSIKRLLSNGRSKFDNIKQYLTSLKMSDLQQIQKFMRIGRQKDFDSLKVIRDFFNSFFAPMEFDDVYLDSNPFKFSIKTPRGEIDIDELSSGEKEILNTFIHFHQLNPYESIILFDEPDVHLHPELERKYLKILRSLSENNQIIITTHAPEMMIEAGSDALFTITKYPNGNENQFIKVSTSEELHDSLSTVMGSKGFVSLNKKIVFIEGEDSSTDIDVYEHFYPSNLYNLSFIPAGNSSTIKSTASKVNILLSKGSTFQDYYCIIDGDLERHADIDSFDNIFQLPVYHIENILLDEDNILLSTNKILGRSCSFSSKEQITNLLKEIAISDEHLLPFTRALLDSKVNKATKIAGDLIYQKRFVELAQIQPITFDSIKDEARQIIENSINNDTWKQVCKGRDLLKAYCKNNNLKYDHFRNLLISNLSDVPIGIKNIMDKIANN